MSQPPLALNHAFRAQMSRSCSFPPFSGANQSKCFAVVLSCGDWKNYLIRYRIEGIPIVSLSWTVLYWAVGVYHNVVHIDCLVAHNSRIGIQSPSLLSSRLYHRVLICLKNFCSAAATLFACLFQFAFHPCICGHCKSFLNWWWRPLKSSVRHSIINMDTYLTQNPSRWGPKTLRRSVNCPVIFECLASHFAKVSAVADCRFPLSGKPRSSVMRLLEIEITS